MTGKTDRELLELAAKAAGIRLDTSNCSGGPDPNTGFDVAGNVVLDWHNGKTWNPLTDDGDALRLAVKLSVCLDISPEAIAAISKDKTICIIDECVNRAIVRAASAIGEKML